MAAPEDDEHMADAVSWLVGMSSQDEPSPLVPELQRRFGLSAVQCCRVMAEAGRVRSAATIKDQSQ